MSREDALAVIGALAVILFVAVAFIIKFIALIHIVAILVEIFMGWSGGLELIHLSEQYSIVERLLIWLAVYILVEETRVEIRRGRSRG